MRELINLTQRAVHLTPTAARIATFLMLDRSELAPTWRANLLQALSIASLGFRTINPFPDYAGSPEGVMGSAFVADVGAAYLRDLQRRETVGEWEDDE